MGKGQESSAKTVLVCALVLENRTREVLLAKRPKGKPMVGLWEFPGGKVRDGEDLAAALIREIAEELAISLAKPELRLIHTVSHDYPDFHLEMPVFLCRRWQGEVKPLEGQTLAWVKPENLGQYAMPAADFPLIKLLPQLLREN